MERRIPLGILTCAEDVAILDKSLAVVFVQLDSNARRSGVRGLGNRHDLTEM